MKNTLLTILMLGGLFGPPSTPEKAAEAYAQDDFSRAIVLFDSATTEEAYQGQKNELIYNMGQCAYRMDSANLAVSFLSKVAGGDKGPQQSDWQRELGSNAWNNIGVIQATSAPPTPPGQGAVPPMGGQGGAQDGAAELLQQAIASFKSALKKDHRNEVARYNYELAMKLLQSQQQQQQEEQEEEQEDDQNKDQENQQQDQEQQQEQQQNQQSEQEKPQPDNQENKGQQKNQQNQQNGESANQDMSLQQAKQLLNAMNEKEKQFIQQLEKKKQKASPYNHEGPDW